MNLKLNALAALVACTAPLFAQASTDHGLQFSGKSFYLYQPTLKHCVIYANGIAGLSKASCNDTTAVRSMSVFQYDHGKIRLTAPNYIGSLNSGTAKNLCLEAASNSSQVKVAECALYPNNSQAQTFQFIKADGNIKGRYYIQNPNVANKCLTYLSSGKYELQTCSNKGEQLFELTHLKDPVHVRMINKSWQDITFYANTKNENNQATFYQQMPWGALNTTRHLLHPISGFSAKDDVEQITIEDNTKSANSIILKNAAPGSIYNIEAHGTLFNSTLSQAYISGTEQIQLFEGSNYAGDRHLFSESQPNLLFLSRNVRSFKIPKNWTVRFYEGANFTGVYYTRTGGDFQNESYGTKIQSFEVLSKPAAIELFDGEQYGGDAYSFTQSQPTLLGFNQKMSSFKVPSGWEVRFYEGENFTGKYYTRNSSRTSDKDITNKVKSFEVLKRPTVASLDPTTNMVTLYDGRDYSGTTLSFSSSQTDLTNFNLRMSSFYIPDGWKVRFYEGKNYTGKYYTRTKSEAHASALDNKICSFEILEK